MKQNLKIVISGESLNGPQSMMIRYSQFNNTRTAVVTRSQPALDPSATGIGRRDTAQKTASGAPATKIKPAVAASGFAANADARSPSRKAVAARVVPQLGHGTEVIERKTQFPR